MRDKLQRRDFYILRNWNGAQESNKCKGFCQHIDINRPSNSKDPVLKRIRKLSEVCVLNMVGAALDIPTQRSQPRQVIVVEGIEGPIFTDAYVGVCCVKMKRRIVWYKNELSATQGLYILNLE